jgi:hypothetical protein
LARRLEDDVCAGCRIEDLKLEYAHLVHLLDDVRTSPEVSLQQQLAKLLEQLCGSMTRLAPLTVSSV